ncbi:biotin/lipoyl-containing protein [Branchiibius cervicis]|uniref:Biotin/lipoyl-containing protein n=1 Tax=Branchiibius cervicis TaxID=908252 RepID=A0ABW2AWR5_9MICO
MRDRLYDAARAAAKAVDYVGAGTVEFLADHDGEFFFLEMNTRLQVEHPVTENVTGLDLVGLQLDVATGLPLIGDEPAMHGWSIEARLYAEDPGADWQPQSGTMSGFAVPGVTERFTLTPTRGIRLDSGTEAGDTIGVHYDPMLAKVIATAPTRLEACRLLAKTLQDSVIEGVVTNRDLLVGVLRDPEFLSGEFDTGYFAHHDPADLTRGQQLSAPLAAVVAAVADAAMERSAAVVDADLPSGWRNVVSAPQTRSYRRGDDDEITVSYRFTRDGVVITSPSLDELRIVSASADAVEVQQAGLRTRYRVGRSTVRDDQRVHVQGPDGSLTLDVVPRFVDPSTLATPGSLVAPMPGVVSRVAVSEGDTVTQGQPLLWLEAMKMEHAVLATADGLVTRLVAQGTQVEPGAVLAVVGDE